ncbi:hypothetical protein KIPB_012594, partial [Kipferlia bialata]|eukprot:g12594.t1
MATGGRERVGFFLCCDVVVYAVLLFHGCLLFTSLYNNIWRVYDFGYPEPQLPSGTLNTDALLGDMFHFVDIGDSHIYRR